MKILKKEFYTFLRKPAPSSGEPIAEEVGIYQLSTMIAKKTKFRVADVQEVLREVGPAIFALLLQRKSVKLGYINIGSRWRRTEWPRYVQDEEMWQFGYFVPTLCLERSALMLYRGDIPTKTDEIAEEVAPYMPNGERTVEDIVETSKAVAKENAALGRNYIVDKDGYVIPPEGSKKKKYLFDENFHPTYYERYRFLMLRRTFAKEWKTGLANGTFPTEEFPDMYTYSVTKLKEAGFEAGVRTLQNYEHTEVETDEDEKPEEENDA